RPLLDTVYEEPLRHLLHQSPRAFGKRRGTWTLALLAQVCFEKAWTPRRLSIETLRQAIRRLGVSWRRAKPWITSPDPADARKKRRGTAYSAWPRDTPAGFGATRTSAGGAAWPSPTCTPGRRRSPCASSSCPRRGTTPTARRCAATACSAATPSRCCCASWTA